MCSKLSALKANQHANNFAASARRLKSHVPLIATVADTLVQGETSVEVGAGGSWSCVYDVLGKPVTGR